MATTAVERRPGWGPRFGGTATLPVACVAVLLVLVDYNAPLVTMPATAASLGTGPVGQTWLVSAISLGLAAAILIVGSLADDYGRRRVFASGTVLFALATAVGALAGDTVVFVLARIVQGVTGAAMLAAGMGLVAHAYPSGAARVRATGIWAAMIGLGVAIGPVVAAGLAELLSWRACYWCYAVVAAVLAGITRRLVVESRATAHRRLDVPGALTLATGLAALLAAVTAGRAGWLRPSVGVLLMVAVVSLAAFVVIEVRRQAPMLDFGLFRHGGFVGATAGALFTGLAVIGLLSYLPTVLQRAMGMSALGTGVLVTLWAGVSVLVSLQARRLVRVPGRWQLAAGLVLSGIGYLPMLGAVGAHAVWRLAVGFLVSGIGYGLLNAALARLAVDTVPADRAAMGSGANSMARYIGTSLGIALTVAVVSGVAGGSDPQRLSHGMDMAMLVAAGLTLVGAAITWCRTRR